MAPPKKKASGGNNNDDAKRETPLQAVLLADSFLQSFRPLSLDKPKVLCPLNNVALLEYALEFLTGAGVEQLFVVCTSDAVEEHLVAAQRQSSAYANLHMDILKDTALTNAGDALRELDKRDVVRSDPFILMFADTVTNVNVTAAIAAHKARHAADPTAIMTILLQEVGASQWKENDTGRVQQSAVRPWTDDLVVGLDPTHANRILLYDDHGGQGSVGLPTSFLATAAAEVDVRLDLADCGIDLCSPDVLARFQDEFDYREIRRMFVANSVAEEEEGLQNKIYAHLLAPGEYAARVSDFTTYAAVSRDLLRRWCWPVVPDHMPSRSSSSPTQPPHRYALQKHSMYYEQTHGKTPIGRSSVVRGAGMMGAQCSVGDDSLVQGTVVGHACVIGSHVRVTDSILWDHVEIRNGATVTQSILANNVVVMEGAVLHKGCVVGAGCVIGKDMIIPAFTRLTLQVEEEDDLGDDWDDDDEKEEDDDGYGERTLGGSRSAEELQMNVEVVGVDGKARVWKAPLEENDDEEIYGLTSAEIVQAQSLGFDPKAMFLARMRTQAEDGDSLSDTDEGQASILSGSDYDDTVEFGAPVAAADVVGRQKGVDVVKELKAICLEYEHGTPIENLAIELNSFKFSQNASYSDCTMAAIMAILEGLQITKESKDGKLVADFKSSLKHWSPLLEKMSIGLEEEKAIMLGLETSALTEGDMGHVLSTGMTFRFFLQLLHDEEVVSEEAVLAWAADCQKGDDDSPRGKLFRMGPVQDFLEWLQEEEEDDSEEDDEEDDDE
jgi:translation initiation factor eIF-2B subunit epsilon